MPSGVVLDNPKFAHNVGQSLRACSIFGASGLRWTGRRVPPPDEWPEGARLPREERMKLYKNVHFEHAEFNTVLDEPIRKGYTPVCVELRDNAEDLTFFQHPENAVYVFGPEDGSVSRGLMTVCHRFVRIPSDDCLNLSMAVGAVLLDRRMKRIRAAHGV